MSEPATAKTPQIFIHDDIHPEDCAMLQALYSRSPDSVVNHLEKVKAAGSGKFMSQFYVGYGHASIGDCGSTTIFLENYSMLAAKAIQDNPLYSGQEASTRYLDFNVQPLYDPYNHPASRAILDGWMALYNRTMPQLQAALKKQYPFDPTRYKSEKVWENATKARAFDILRGFLPIGTTTLFSWSTNLRQARDQLMRLKFHPLPEIRQLARDLFGQIRQKYPNSFTGEEMAENGRYAQRDAYAQAEAGREHFVSRADLLKRGRLTAADEARLKQGEMVVDRRALDLDSLRANEKAALAGRPSGAALSRRFIQYGTYNLYFKLDFGSFRDIQRHRNGLGQVPLVENWCGILPWYSQQLEEHLGDGYPAFAAEVARLFAAIPALPAQGVQTTPWLDQYLHPMGTAVLCHAAYTVPQVLYVAELRSQKTVHPTLRPIAQAMGQVLAHDLPGLALYLDTDADGWNAKRGEQTIEAKAPLPSPLAPQPAAA
jgi:thymidylate synthase ThyX